MKMDKTGMISIYNKLPDTTYSKQILLTFDYVSRFCPPVAQFRVLLQKPKATSLMELLWLKLFFIFIFVLQYSKESFSVFLHDCIECRIDKNHC